MSDAAKSGLVPQMLQEYGALTRAALTKYLPTGKPRRYLYDLLTDYPGRGGKMMRPSLCIATARAFGARPDDAVLTAVAIELIHNALLIHDDIEDESEQRRGRPTLHLLHGIPLALNAGDMMVLASLKPLIDNWRGLGPHLSIRIFEETERMARESAEGQAMELGWRSEPGSELSESDYLEMVLKKTCWLAAIYPSRVGAIIGTRDAIDLEPFIRFGFFLGASFQIQDDLLNLIANEAYGKELNGDLREGKRTLMLIQLLRESSPEENAELLSVLKLPREQRTDAQICWMRKLMDKYGCIDYARQIALGLAGAALHEYSLLYAGLPDSRDRRFIEEMATWVVTRN